MNIAQRTIIKATIYLNVCVNVCVLFFMLAVQWGFLISCVYLVEVLCVQTAMEMLGCGIITPPDRMEGLHPVNYIHFKAFQVGFQHPFQPQVLIQRQETHL